MSDIVKQVAAATGVEGVGRTVLVSGVTGFVGTAVALEYLKHGFRVHATARSQEKADDWLDLHYIARLNTKFFIVKDAAGPGAFDEAIKGVEIVAHTASPFHFDTKDNVADMLSPALDGTNSMLESAAKTPSVKRMVITSSFAAIFDYKQGPRVGFTYSHTDMNPATYDEAKNSDDPGFVYCASKLLAETAAWDFVKARKPGFELSTICPPGIFGPAYQVVKDLDNLNTSSAQIWGIINGKSEKIEETAFPVGCDVRDVAKMHVLASTLDVAKGQRYLTITFHYSNDQIAALLRKAFPDKASRIPKTGDGKPPFQHFDTDSTKAEKDFGIKWIGFEQCMKDTASKLWEIEASLQNA